MVRAHGMPRRRRGAPGPQAGPPPGRARWTLNGSPPPRPPSRCADPKRSPWVAFRNRSAHAARAPRTASFEDSASLAFIPPCRASRALAPAPFDGCTHSPSLRIRSQARCGAPCLQDTDSCAQPSFLRFPAQIILPRFCRRGEGRAARYCSLPPEARNRLAADSVREHGHESRSRSCSRSTLRMTLPAASSARIIPRASSRSAAPVLTFRTRPSVAPFILRTAPLPLRLRLSDS